MAPPPPPPPAAAASPTPMLLALTGLSTFSDRLVEFFNHWNSFIRYATAISDDLPPLPAADQPPNLADVAEPESTTPHSPVAVDEPESSTAPNPVAVAVAEPKPAPVPQPEEPRPNRGGDPSAEHMGRICERMGSGELLRFVISRMGDLSWLLHAVPPALRRAPNPAELVLRAIGRYYIRPGGRHTEAACELLLLSYVRAGCPLRPGQEAGDDHLRAEAREAALSWRSRLVRSKGRVAAAAANDARGLLLLMAAFGVPVEFPSQEIFELLHAAGGLACAEVLKCSKHFLDKLRDVVAHMLNRGIYHQTVATIIAFELQDAFPLSAIATCVIERVGRTKDQDSQEQHHLPGSKENDEEKLALLRLLSKYVEDPKQCSTENFSIADRIAMLEQSLAKPHQAFTGTKRKRTAQEDSVECTRGPKCSYTPAASSASRNKNLEG
ncbi:protein FRIGIDA-like isoform X1 [Oryza glaberrima]|uniref:FRIGIDA-like protein n=2 Tax=Oryza TaxID=4527 RepID=A0A0D3FRF4_9ORYZ|nr:protein FRIGIDA-like isoform X1 [Oryza glaberrima]XP_052148407.1 protein FRIGIDA-like isoform X1 [Oryza glaberrima]